MDFTIYAISIDCFRLGILVSVLFMISVTNLHFSEIEGSACYIAVSSGVVGIVGFIAKLFSITNFHSP
jgi:hypothetical protein